MNKIFTLVILLLVSSYIACQNKWRVGAMKLTEKYVKSLLPENEKNRSIEFLDTDRFNHVAFLLGNDFFEFLPTGIHRIENYNTEKDTKFDWHLFGDKLNGKTYTNTEQLLKKLKDAGWNDKKFEVIGGNCHDFVEECLKIVGAPSSMFRKNSIVFKRNYGK